MKFSSNVLASDESKITQVSAVPILVRIRLNEWFLEIKIFLSIVSSNVGIALTNSTKRSSRKSSLLFSGWIKQSLQGLTRPHRDEPAYFSATVLRQQILIPKSCGYHHEASPQENLSFFGRSDRPSLSWQTAKSHYNITWQCICVYIGVDRTSPKKTPQKTPQKILATRIILANIVGFD